MKGVSTGRLGITYQDRTNNPPQIMVQGLRGSFERIELAAKRAKDYEPFNLLHVRLSELALFIAFNALLFEPTLSELIPGANYIDEVAVALLLIVTVLETIKDHKMAFSRINWLEAVGFLSLAAMVVIGLLSNIFFEVRTDIKPIAVDVYACTKFLLTVLCGEVVIRDFNNLYRLVLFESKSLLLLMLPFLLASQVLDIGMGYDFRYGLRSFQFVFGHPSSLNAAVVGIFLILLVDAKRHMKWIALCWVYLLLSLRSTGIAFAALGAIVLLPDAGAKRIKLMQALLILVVSVYIGWGQFAYYFIESDGSARAELLRVSMLVAERFCPFGSGFATFGSNITAQPEYYSPLYYQYGLNEIFGLSPGNVMFLSDSFWPIVIGQFGLFGCALFIASLICFFEGRASFYRVCSISRLPLIFMFIYLLISSLGSSAFFHPMSVYIAFCFSIVNGELIVRFRDAQASLSQTKR